MKMNFKKNQLIITALAVMIAIAGYLKYSDSLIDSKQLAQTSVSGENVVVQKPMIAITKDAVSVNGKYQMILHPEMIG